MLAGTHPILSCEDARRFEAGRFGGDEAKEWAAMQAAGAAIAAGVRRDCEEIGGFRAEGRVLVLVGKGHNGGDALIAAAAMLARSPETRADVVFAFGERTLRPLAARAWRDLATTGGGRVQVRGAEAVGGNYAVCLDGIFGFQFRPPVDAAVAALIDRVNALPIRLRAAVDLPSADRFQADFTFATGAVKIPLLTSEAAGRVRYLDLGFFRGETEAAGARRVLTPAVLAPLAGLRSPRSDKRTYGHLCVLGGSRSYPGAVLMTVLAALRSGAGLVTAFVPESVAATFAARAPEAMWVGWPETPDGGLALEGLHLLRERIERATALVIGPGMAREAETLALAGEVVKSTTLPVLLDADALQRDVIAAAKGPLVVTPHAGEFARIAGEATLEAYAEKTGAVVVLKGPVTRVCGGEGAAEERGQTARATEGDGVVYHSFFGGPVLARGGSGDLLAGLIGGLLAQTPSDRRLAAARGVVWHGLAADALARAQGQVAVNTTQLLEFLATALRDSAESEPPASRCSRSGPQRMNAAGHEI